MNNDGAGQVVNYISQSDCNNVQYVPSQSGSMMYSSQSGSRDENSRPQVIVPSNKRRKKNSSISSVIEHHSNRIAQDYISAQRGSEHGYDPTQLQSADFQSNSNNAQQPLTFETALKNQHSIHPHTRSLSMDHSRSAYNRNQNVSGLSHVNSVSGTQYWPFTNVGQVNQMVPNGRYSSQDINQNTQAVVRQQQQLAAQNRETQNRSIRAAQQQSADYNSNPQHNFPGCWLFPQSLYFPQSIESTTLPELSSTFNSNTTDSRIQAGQMQQFGQTTTQQYSIEAADILQKIFDNYINQLKDLNDLKALPGLCSEIASSITNHIKYPQEIFLTPGIQQKLLTCLQLIWQNRQEFNAKQVLEVFQKISENPHRLQGHQAYIQQCLKELGQTYITPRIVSRNEQIAVPNDASMINGNISSRVASCPQTIPVTGQLQAIRPTQYQSQQQRPMSTVPRPIVQRRPTNNNTERVDRSKWAGRFIDHAWSFGLPSQTDMMDTCTNHQSPYHLTKGSIYLSQDTFNRIWRSETPKIPVNATTNQLPLTYRLISRRTKNIDIDPRTEKCDWPPEDVAFTVTINNNVVKLERKQRVLHHGVEQYQGVDRPVDVSRYMEMGWNHISISQCGCNWCLQQSTDREISIQVFLWESEEIVLRLARVQRLTYEHGLSIAKVKRAPSGESNGSVHLPTSPASTYDDSGNLVTEIDDDDDDVTAYMMTVSLKCPLSMVRIREPAKGLHCVHIGCFDLETYVQVNIGHTKWACPVCNGVVTSETLRVDDYFIKLLQQFSSNVSKIAIDDNGIWTIVEHDDNDFDSSGDECSNVKKRDHIAKESTLIVIDDDEDAEPSTGAAPLSSNEAQRPSSNGTVSDDMTSCYTTQMYFPPDLESLASVAATQMHLPQLSEQPSEPAPTQIQQLNQPLDSPRSTLTLDDVIINDHEFEEYDIDILVDSPLQENQINFSPRNNETRNDRTESDCDEEEEIVSDWVSNPLYYN